jgi:hypothetical protein
MDTVVIVIIIVVVVAVAAVAAAFVYQRRRSHQLQQRFGTEYQRTVEASDDRQAAERDLQAREQRRSKLDVTPLTGESAGRYRDEWNTLQQEFVDEPGNAVVQADRLVLRMMRESGYPVDEFDQRVADISVDHPDVAETYREAHRVAVAQAQGQTDTEELRQAVTAYRHLVYVLLADSGDRDERHPAGPADGKEQS